MRRATALMLATLVGLWNVAAQNPPQKPNQESKEEILRITTELVQTDVVVMDKNDQIVPDLKLEDFEIYDNGKKQELQFVEFVSIDASRTNTAKNAANKSAIADVTVPKELSASDVRRVIAFVIDDVTIPSEDMSRTRQMLTDFVDNKMVDGDLVAIVRTVGGKGLLEQFTTDRQILRRAIGQLGVRTVPPYLAFTGSNNDRITGTPQAVGDATEVGVGGADPGATQTIGSEFEGPSEGTNQIPRGVLALSVSNYVVDSLRQIPGRKNLVLVSGGLPLFDLSRTGAIVGDIGQLFQQLTDNATRSGVVVNTLDIRGLQTQAAAPRFDMTPAKSALPSTIGELQRGSNEDPTFGRGADEGRLGGTGLSELLSLRGLAARTGGVSVNNTNNFSTGLETILNRSRGYYRLAYRPTEKFDNKFHKLDVKARRGAHVYNAGGYFAHEDKESAAKTKEQEITAAALSPLAKRDLDVAAELLYRFSPDNQAALDINAFIDAKTLNFTKTPEGKYHTSFDVAGFVLDQLGKDRGGISQTISADLSEQDYRRALTTGVSYTASTKLNPGYYQVRLVVRENETGKIGTVSRYFEVPDLSNKKLTMSSLFLYGLNPSGGASDAQQLPATRVISRTKDLRYVAVVYNAKASTGRAQLRSQLIISQGGKILFQEPEQPLESKGNAEGQYVKVGQLGLSKVAAGQYILTLVVTDDAADKKNQRMSRSIDFKVVN